MTAKLLSPWALEALSGARPKTPLPPSQRAALVPPLGIIPPELSSKALTASGVLALQAAAGNRAVSQLISGSGPATQRQGSPLVAVQRAGVRSELKNADSTFTNFIQDTHEIHDVRDRVSTDLYDAYKPSGGMHWSKGHAGIDRDKPKMGWVDQKTAVLRAERLSHWTNTAVDSASRIYAELLAAVEWMKALRGGGEDITMGQNTSEEADVTLKGDTALEVKHIVTGAQGGVDTHVAKASSQLLKRKVNNAEGGVRINNWVATVYIQSGENPWPFTPVALHKMINAGKVPAGNVLAQAMAARIQKYRKAGKAITWHIVVAHPRMSGTYTVIT